MISVCLNSIRSPFGLKCSGHNFVRAITRILRPVRNFTDSFVDDVAVHSNRWKEHMGHLSRYLQSIEDAGITLNLKKMSMGTKPGEILWTHNWVR